MRVAVMGSGGLGGYYGALLAKAGATVTFIARGEHLATICRQGLQVRSVHEDFLVRPAHAVESPDDVGIVELVLFAVKTYDTEAAAHELLPMIGPETIVLTFQNGVDCHERIDSIIGPGHTVVAPTQIASTLAAPGLIVQESPFRNTVIGEVHREGLTARVEELVALFARTGVNAAAAEDGLKPLWHKFVFLASVAGLTALARTPAAELFHMPEARTALRAAMEEIHTVGRAVGIPMDGDIVERQYQFSLGLKPGIKASMHVDLERGRRLEIDALSGAVLRIGNPRGIPTPVHQTLYVGLKQEDLRASLR